VSGKGLNNPARDKKNANQELAEWTIMVFLNADNDLEEEGLEDFMEMSAVGSSEKVNVVVQFDRTPNESDDYEDWTQTLRFLVKKGTKPRPSEALEDLSEVDMGSKDSLADFIRWAQAKFPAKRYMLNIWDHGQGWRFRTASIPKLTSIEAIRLANFRTEELKQIKEQPKIPTNKVISSTVRYISHDATNGSKLWNREIQNTFEKVFAGQKVNVIGFDACLMSMMETAYAMRNSASVMVGSEELEPGTGWNYKRILTKLSAKPDVESDVLGRIIVDSYKENYEDSDTRTTLSAIDLSKIDTLAVSVSAMSDVLINKLDAELENIKIARSNCRNYGARYGLHGIDLGRFSDQLSAVTTDNDVRDSIKIVRDNLAAAVIHNYIGRSRGDEHKFGSNGLAIYFPISMTAYKGDQDRSGYDELNTEYPVEFVEKHKWDNFLHRYFEKVP
jgi:hypothetical protein